MLTISESEIRYVLMETQTIAVVGMSNNPDRDSYGVAKFLKRHGYTIIPVNPTLQEPVLDSQPYASLRDIPRPVDMILVFRKPEFAPEIVDDSIAIGARVVWMQPGASNADAARRAKHAGLIVALDHCIAIEHRRLMRDFEPLP